jgi:hypothetical protein
LLFDIVYASQLDIFRFALEYLNSLLATVHIEEIVGKDKVAIVGIDLHALGVSLRADYDLIALNSCFKLGIYELKVLGSGEENGAFGYYVSIHFKLIGAIIVKNVGLIEIGFGECEGG